MPLLASDIASDAWKSGGNTRIGPLITLVLCSSLVLAFMSQNSCLGIHHYRENCFLKMRRQFGPGGDDLGEIFVGFPKCL